METEDQSSQKAAHRKSWASQALCEAHLDPPLCGTAKVYALMPGSWGRRPEWAAGLGRRGWLQPRPPGESFSPPQAGAGGRTLRPGAGGTGRCRSPRRAPSRAASSGRALTLPRRWWGAPTGTRTHSSSGRAAAPQPSF